MKNDYSRQIESLRRSRRHNTDHKRKGPIQLDELLGRPSHAEILGLYQIDLKNGRLLPNKVPKRSGDMVVVEPGTCPKECENNIICDDVYYVGEREFKTWIPLFKFYVGQFVTFWTKQSEYIFQIHPAEDSRYGLFVLHKKSAVVRQPGKDSRTARTKSV